MKIEQAKIITNKKIARIIWKMEMLAPNVYEEVQGPGQFINILVDESWNIPLRRPMSIAGTNRDQLTIIYKVLGKGTKRLVTKLRGDILNILGPIGNVFNQDMFNNHHPILIGGGIGMAPILWLHNVMKERSVQHELIIGAKSKSDHFLKHQPSRKIYLTTDDGTLGIKGTVMRVLQQIVNKLYKPMIVACGPVEMLKVIQTFLIDNNIPGQMALESYMACGLGICQGCVVELTHSRQEKHSFGEKYSLICRDGPVYDISRVRF